MTTQIPQRPQTQLARNAVIPPELKNLHQWARWVKGTRDKMPANLDGSAMKWGDPANWLTFDEVARYPQIGYFHSLESGIIGIDFDGCRDKETGAIHPLVLGWIRGTYAEVSPNEEGVKAYFKGTIPNGKAIQNKIVPWGDPEGHTGIECKRDKSMR
jgi:primase-polymerase (primpol)-like protein